MTSLILPILVFLVFYFFIIKPKQAKLKAAQEEQMKIGFGDRVMTQSGIYGRVSRLSQDLAVVEVAPGVEMVFNRRSVLKAPPTVDVDDQLSEPGMHEGFSEEEFSELQDHLGAQSSSADEAAETPVEAGPEADQESLGAVEESRTDEEPGEKGKS